jgi:nucleotide-binding universal stress UspA family protein
MTIRTILAATDFSSAAGRAVERAAALTARHQAMLHLLHVAPHGWLPALRAWASGSPAGPGPETEIEARLARDAGALGTARGIAVNTRLATGDSRVLIPEIAAELGADLLVVGAHGSHFVRDLLLGSTALAALALAPCPVLAVRLSHTRAYRSAVAGSDLSPWSASAIRAAAELAPEAQFAVLHAYEDPYGAQLLFASISPEEIGRYRADARAAVERTLEDFLASLGPLAARCSRTVRHGPPVRRLGEELQASGADLVVLGSRNRTGIDRMMLGSVAEQVALEAPCDVLLVRGERAVAG